MTSRRRSTVILRAALATLKRNPQLLWFTAMMAVASALAAMAAGSLAWLGAHLIPGIAGDPEVQGRAGVVFLLATWFGLHLLARFFGVALARATLEALAARGWTVAGSLRHAAQRVPSIATFALLDASVGGIVSRLKRRGGRVAAKLVGLSWWAATYLIVPVIAHELRGGIAAIARSTTLLRQTWKEAFVGRLVLGWLWVPVVFASLTPLGILLAIGIRATPILVAAISLPIAVWLALGVVLHTLDTIYRCALYVFATEGVVPTGFDDPDLHELWCTRSD